MIHINVRKYQSRGGWIRQQVEDTLIPANITPQQDGQHRGLGLTHTHTSRDTAQRNGCVCHMTVLRYVTLSVCRCILKICCTCAKSVLLHIEDEGKGCVCVLAGVGEHGKRERARTTDIERCLIRV